MKLFLAATLLLLCTTAALPLHAQDKPRKSLTFQPGSKTPDATPAPAASPKSSPAAKANPSSKQGAATPIPEKAAPAVETSSDAPAAAPASAGAAPTDEAAQIAASFFNLLQKNQVEEAYGNLTRGSKIAERPDELRTLKAKTTEAIQIFGSIHGYELLDTKSVGTNLLRRTYISLGRDFPLRWRFYFYRTEKQWRLVDIRVDDRLGGLFDEPEEPRPPEPKP